MKVYRNLQSEFQPRDYNGNGSEGHGFLQRTEVLVPSIGKAANSWVSIFALQLLHSESLSISRYFVQDNLGFLCILLYFLSTKNTLLLLLDLKFFVYVVTNYYVLCLHLISLIINRYRVRQYFRTLYYTKTQCLGQVVSECHKYLTVKQHLSKVASAYAQCYHFFRWLLQQLVTVQKLMCYHLQRIVVQMPMHIISTVVKQFLVVTLINSLIMFSCEYEVYNS